MSRFPISFVSTILALAIVLLLMSVARTAVANRAEITPGSLNFEAVSPSAAIQLVTASTFDADGNAITPTSWTWTSSDENVATVSSHSTSGTPSHSKVAGVSAVGEGTATIAFSAETPPSGNSPATTVTATSTVTVTLDDARLEVSPARLTFGSLGEKQTVSVRVYDENNNEIEDAPFGAFGVFSLIWPDDGGPPVGGAAEWRKVPGGLEVTARGNGGGSIEIVIANGQRVTLPVSVSQVPTTLTVTPGSLNLDEGETATLQATMTDANGHAVQVADGDRGGMVVRWETSDSAVATVEGSLQDSDYGYEAGGTATVTAVGEGAVTITARWLDLTTTVTGTTTALRSARSTAQSATLTEQVHVTVSAREAPEGARIEVSPTELHFTALGETQTLSIRIYDENGDEIEDPTVFVSSIFPLMWPDNGNYTTLLDGQDAEPGDPVDWRDVPGGPGVTLEVTSLGHGGGEIGIVDMENGEPPYRSTVTVRVSSTQVPTTFAVTPESLNLVVGETATLQATMTDANGYEIKLADYGGGRWVAWETSDSAVVTIEGTVPVPGTYARSPSVTAVAAGSATITATHGDFLVETQVSVGTATQTSANTAPTGLPTISGTARVGETLTASATGIADADGLSNATFAWQWVANDGTSDADIAGATGAEYTLTSAEAGKTIRVRATFTDDRGTEETVLSDATAMVEAEAEAPAIVAGGVQVTSTPQAASDTYGPGETIELTVTFDKAVTVDTTGGMPRIQFRLGPPRTDRWAQYSGGSGNTALTFTYEVQPGDIDSNGIWLPKNQLQLQSGAIRDAATSTADAILDYARAGLRSGHKVDGSLIDTPAIIAGGVQVTSTPQAASDTYGSGETIELTVTFDETVTVDTTGGMPRIQFRLGPPRTDRWAEYSGGSGNTALTFTYEVQPGDIDSNGIWLPKNQLQLQGGAIRDAASDTVDAALGYANAGLQSGHKVDGSLIYTPASNAAPTGLPTISGTPRVGETLAASSAGISDSDGLTQATFAWQWIANDGTSDSDIPGATGAEYTLTPAEEGKTIKVRATFTDDGAAEETLVSEATAAVEGLHVIYPVSTGPISVSVQCVDMAANIWGPQISDDDTDLSWEMHFSAPGVRSDDVPGTSKFEITGQDGNAFDWFIATGGPADRFDQVFRWSTSPTSAFSDVNGVVITVPAGGWQDKFGNLNTASANSLYLAHNWKVSVADARATEGTDGTIDFEVTLNARDDCETATVDWTTSDGTATAGEDYAAASGTLTFGPGETSKTIRVALLETADEGGSETFSVRLSNASGMTLDDAEATGWITGVRAVGKPTVTGTARVGETLTALTTDIADVDGLTSATFTWQWIANDGTADADIAGATAATYTLTPAETGKTIKVRVSFTDDGGIQQALVSDPTATVAAVLTPEVSITAGNNTTTQSVTAQLNSVTEGTAAVFTLTRTGWPANALTVNVSVTETGTMLSGTVPATVTFNANSSTAELRIETEDDEVAEPASAVTAALAAGSGYSMDTDAASATVTVEDDDAVVVQTAAIVTVPENTTAITTLTATEDDTPIAYPNIVWSIVGGADAAMFTVSAGGDLAFASAKDFEAPDDADADGDYEVTVRATGIKHGSYPAEAALTVRLIDVDDVSPVLIDANVNGGWLTLAFSEPLHRSVSVSAFSVAVDGAARGVRVGIMSHNSGNMVNLGLASAVVSGETVTVGYTVPTGAHTQPLRDVAGNLVAGFSDEAVTNDTPASNATGLPTISGTARVGETLTASSTGISDVDGLTNATFAWQWIANDGTADTDIVGATAETYTLTSAEVGKTLKVRATFTDDRGTEETVLSDATAAVTTAYTCTAPNLAGRTEVWTGTMAVETVESGGSVIGYGFNQGPDGGGIYGALSDTSFDFGGSSYTIDSVVLAIRPSPVPGLVVMLDKPLPDTERKRLRLHVCGDTFDLASVSDNYLSHANRDKRYWWANPGIDWSSATTLSLALSGTVNQAATGAPVIAGTPQVGQTLTAGPGDIADGNGIANGKFAWQWIANDGTSDADIAGATGAEYTLTSAEEGKTIKVRVTFTDDGGTEETLVSEATAAVATDVFPEHTGPISVSVQCVDSAYMFDDFGSIWWEMHFSAPVRRVRETGGARPFEIAGQDDTDFTWFAVGTLDAPGFDAPRHTRYRYNTTPKVPRPGDGLPSAVVSDVNGVVITVPSGGWQDMSGNLNFNTASANALYLAHNWMVSVADASTTEGTDGTIDFEVTLNARDDCKTVTVDWTTADGTATAGEDYAAASGTLTFGPGETSKTIRVALLETADVDGSETFSVQLGNASGIALDDAEAIGTISGVGAANVPATGKPTVTGTARVGETLTASASGITDADGLTNATYAWQWIANDGTSDADIAGATGAEYTLTSAEEGKTIKVRVTFTDDGGTEETLVSEATAAVTVALPSVSIAAVSSPVTEGTAASFTLRRTGDTAAALTVAVSVTVEGAVVSATPASSVTIATGSAEATLSVATVDDSVAKADARVTVAVTAGAGYQVGSGAGSAGVDVFDDDRVASAPVKTLWTSTLEWQGDYGAGWVNASEEDFSSPAWAEDGHDYRIWYIAYGSSKDELWVRADPNMRAGGIPASGELTLQVGDVTVESAGAMAKFARGDIAIVRGIEPNWAVGEQVQVRLTRTTAGETTVTGPGVSVADAQVQEAEGAVLAFRVTLAEAQTSAVSVRYATSDGTATAGADYVAQSGVLRFAPGEVQKTVSVPVLNDAHDEGSETLLLTLSRPFGAQLADGEATGTIVNSDPMPRAWITRFGRTVGSQVVDAVTGRFEDGDRSHLTVGGVSLSGQRPFPVEQWDWNTSETELDPWLGGREMTERELLLGSSFHLSSRERSDGGAKFAAWGRVAIDGFEADVDDVKVEGDVTTGLIGFDAEWDRMLAGLLLSQSTGEGSYALGGDFDGDRGTVESSLTGIYPYARLELSERVSAWGLVGVGQGELTLRQEGGTRIDTDLAMRMGAVGVRGAVLDGSGPSGVGVSVKSDAMWVRTESDGVEGLESAEGDVTRLRLILEGERVFEAGEGATFTPTGQVGLRHDGGDAETGAGVELGAGIRYTAGALTIEGQVRTLVAHEESGYEEWGASGAFRVSPDGSGRGLSFALAPSWGSAASGAEHLWSARDATALARSSVLDAGGRLEAELGYGVGLARNVGVITPYAGLSLEAGENRTYRAGTRWRLSPEATFSLEGTRHGGTRGEGSANGIIFRAAVQF